MWPRSRHSSPMWRTKDHSRSVWLSTTLVTFTSHSTPSLRSTQGGPRATGVETRRRFLTMAREMASITCTPSGTQLFTRLLATSTCLWPTKHGMSTLKLPRTSMSTTTLISPLSNQVTIWHGLRKVCNFQSTLSTTVSTLGLIFYLFFCHILTLSFMNIRLWARPTPKRRVQG